jgi:hypothetical protein
MDEEENLELGRQIWHLCKAGYDRIEILKELGITLQQLEDAYRAFESQVAVDAGRAMEHFRFLDDERIEDLIGCWMQAALGDPEQPLETTDDAEFDLRLRASYAVLAGIGARQKILQACCPEKTSVEEGSANIVAWLQRQLPAGISDVENLN